MPDPKLLVFTLYLFLAGGVSFFWAATFYVLCLIKDRRAAIKSEQELLKQYEHIN